jgi:predicted nucleic acid-binding protein
MDKIYIDCDIVLDLLSKREPFFKSAAALFSMVERGEINACVSPLIFTNLFYILRKAASAEKAIDTLKKFRLLVDVLPVNEKIIELALSSGLPDFEDSLHYYTALENGIYCLITRNKKHYKKPEIIICTAEEFVQSKKVNQ